MAFYPRRKNILAAIIAVLVPILFYLYFQFFQSLDGIKEVPKYKPVGIDSSKLNDGDPSNDTIYHKIPPFEFVAHTGDTVTHRDFRGHITVANFFFISCPTICPEMMESLESVQNAYYNDDVVKIISHTVDPEHDTVEALRKYALKNNAKEGKWYLVRGKQDSIYDMARWGYFVTAEQGSGPPTGFVHSPNLVLVDKKGVIRGYYDGTKEKEVNELVRNIGYLKMRYQQQRLEKERQKRQ